MPGSIKIDDGSGNYTILTSPTSLGSDKTFTLASPVLQVVQGTLSSAATTSSGSYNDTGLTVSITPTATSSKILIAVSHNVFTFSNSTLIGGNIQLVRGSTSIIERRFILKADDHPSDDNMYIGTAFVINHLDSPSTTSATTYKTQYKWIGTGGSGYVGVANENYTDSIIAIEIGG